MSAPLKIAVFASGSGSNFAAIAQSIAEGRLAAQVMVLFSDEPQAYALTRAQEIAVPTLQLSPADYLDRAAYETAILAELRQRQVDLIVLAGYLRIIGPTLREAFPQKIINIHPSLLPAYPGLNSIAKALAAGEAVTGVTVHYIDAGVDTGPIIAQEEIHIAPEDSVASLTAKVHQVEHRLYPAVLRDIILKTERKLP